MTLPTFRINAQNTWTQKADFGGGSRYAMVGVTIGTKGYMGMGYDGSVNKKDMWEYDPVGNTWTQKADFGGSLRGGFIFNSSDTKAYVGFGNDGSYKNDWWEYNPTSNDWTQKTSCPGNSRQSGTSFRIGNNIYITTGFNGSTEYKDLWCYNIDTDSWTQKTDFGGTARYSATAFSIGIYGYVGCGSDDLSWINNDFWEYNSLTDKWTQKNDFAGQDRRTGLGLSIGNKGYIIAGDGSPIQYLNDIWEYSQHNDTWTQKTNKLGVGVAAPSGFSINEKLYVGCGFNHLFSPNFRFDFYEYTPGTTPSVNTTIISNITTTTASSGGNVAFDGSYSVTARGVVWSTSANPTIASQPGGGITSNGTGDGSFTSSLTGLTAGTQYYYRAYATNSQGTSYGEQYTFTTTQTGGTWARQTDFPMTGREGASGFEYNNIGYVANGSNSTFHNDVWSYNPTTCQWLQKNDFGSVDRYHSGAVSLNSKSYILGGYDLNNNYLQDFWEYNPATDLWTQKSNIPSGARFRPAIFTIGSYIYAGIGAKGSGTSNYQNDFYQYDPVANTWTAKANFGGTARLGTVYFATSTKGYVGLGYDNTGSYKNDLWEYDPVGNTWTQRANYIGNSRDMAKGFSINDKGFVLTGIQSNGTTNTTDNYEYDPVANTWAARTSFPGSARYATTGFVLNDILYIGMGYNGVYLSDFYSYKPNSEPTITTTAISSIATTSASSGGNVTATGGEAVTARGLVWSSTNNTPTISDYEGITTNGTGTGSFTQTLNALCPGTTYYVRAYATNSIGTSYGTVQTFTTTSSAGEIWVQKANFGGSPRVNAVSFTIGSKGYVGTGYDGTPKQDFWEYDINSDVWTQKANITGIRYQAVGFSIGAKGYIGTGYNDVSELNSFYEYDPTLNTWTAKANFGGGNRRIAFGFAINGKGYIGGGFDGSSQRQDMWEFDPNLNTWTVKANFGGGNGQGQQSFVIANKAYVGTGNINGVTYSKVIYEYNPSLNSWTQKSDYGGTAHSAGVAFSIGNKGYIGTGSTAGPKIDEFWEYDPNKNNWTQKANFGGGIRYSAFAFQTESKGYIGAGFNAGFLNTFYEYTPSTIPMFFSSEASNITQLTAFLSAEYDNNFNGCGDGSITDKGFVWDVNPNPTIGSNEGAISIGIGNSNFNYTIENLNHSSTYYVRAYTTNSNGTVYGNEVSFVTLAPTAPVLGTLSNLAFGDDGIALSFPLTSIGGEDISNSGFIYSTSPNPNINNYPGGGIINYDPEIGTNYYNLTGLNPETTYYLVSFAENAIGITYSNEITFTTKPSSNDDDNDGILDEDELIGPNNGDGNGDRIPDALQANIASFMFDANGNFVTVEATNCASLTEVRQAIKDNDPNWYYPFGAIEFSVPCGEVEMKIYYHSVSSLFNYIYRKTNQRGEWGEYEGAVFGQEEVGGTIVATVIFPLEDGKYGDSDGITNGVIYDPGGPALPVTANIPFWDWWWIIFSIPFIIIFYKKYN